MELWGIFPQARLAAPEFVDRVERLDAAELAPLFVDAGRCRRWSGAGWKDSIWQSVLLSDPDMTIARNLARRGVKRVIGGSFRVRPGVHAVYQLAAVLDQLGLTLHDPIPRLSVGPNLKRPSCLGFHMGSGSARKNWPIERWIELTESLDGLFDDFLLVGGEADNELVREFCSRCRIRRLRSLLNANLSELSLALNECRFFVGHDTGVTHLAAAVGTPTVALFGATDPAVWAPLGEHVGWCGAPTGLMESIGVGGVVEALRRGEVETARRMTLE